MNSSFLYHAWGLYHHKCLRCTIAASLQMSDEPHFFYYHLVVLESRNFTTLSTSSLKIVILYFTNNETLTFFI